MQIDKSDQADRIVYTIPVQGALEADSTVTIYKDTAKLKIDYRLHRSLAVQMGWDGGWEEYAASLEAGQTITNV